MSRWGTGVDLPAGGAGSDTPPSLTSALIFTNLLFTFLSQIISVQAEVREPLLLMLNSNLLQNPLPPRHQHSQGSGT